MSSGIYQIYNKISHKSYIGSSKNIENRWKAHKHFLNKNLHPNIYLQRAWNKHKEESFEFGIIENCDEYLLEFREQFWMNQFNFNKQLYNISKNAKTWRRGTSLYTLWLENFGEEIAQQKYNDWVINLTKSRIGSKNGMYQKGYLLPWYNKKRPEHSKAMKKNNPFKGKHHKEEIKKQWSLERKGHLLLEETKQKISFSTSGSKNPMYNKSVLDIWIQKYGKEKADEMWKEKNEKGKGLRIIHKDDQEKRIKPEQLQQYFDFGWKKGRRINE